MIRIPLIDVHLVRQPPGRITTFIRNQLAMFRLAHIPLAWKARAALMLTVHSIAQVIASRQKRAMLNAVWRGWADGLRGRLGPP